MKTKEEIKTEGKPVFYAILYESMRKAALDCGYALGLHGSMQSDMDLMAMPWTNNAVSSDDLAAALDDCIGHTVWKQDRKYWDKTRKPHGRISYTLAIIGDWHIDLCVMPILPALSLSGQKEGEELSADAETDYAYAISLLGELVYLKDLKDKEGKTEEYLQRQPEAWQRVRKFLDGELPTPSATEAGKCLNCNGMGIVSDEHHGHAITCSQCFGTGIYPPPASIPASDSKGGEQQGEGDTRDLTNKLFHAIQENQSELLTECHREYCILSDNYRGLADILAKVSEKHYASTMKMPSETFQDTEADGIVFCGKCGKQK